MSDPTIELIFKNEVVAQMVAGGWQRGSAEKYDRALALYPEDVIGFVQDTQPGFRGRASSSRKTLRRQTTHGHFP